MFTIIISIVILDSMVNIIIIPLQIMIHTILTTIIYNADVVEM